MLLKNNCELCFAFADPKACIFHNKHFSSQNFWCFCCFSFVLSSDYWYVCCAWPNAFVPLRTIAHHWQMNKSQQHLNARETVALIFIFFFIKTSAILCMGRQIMQSSSSSVMWLGCGSVCGICSMQQQHKKKTTLENNAPFRHRVHERQTQNCAKRRWRRRQQQQPQQKTIDNSFSFNKIKWRKTLLVCDCFWFLCALCTALMCVCVVGGVSTRITCVSLFD